MGRFELLIGEERDGSPVYQQAHSREMPENDEVLLFRWGGKTKISIPINDYFKPGLETSGWLNEKGILL